MNGAYKFKLTSKPAQYFSLNDQKEVNDFDNSDILTNKAPSTDSVY